MTQDKVPVVVEMIPYRRRDGTVFRDLDMHPYLAGLGVATCRVDIRGAGDSDGILRDEYLPQEQDDACEIIALLAAQAWCNGNVGMTGISWGGFNSLQVAARRPPALKAIITLCSTDDRYADDVHYMGGCLITENEMWSTFMLAKNAMPPDPQIVGDALARHVAEAARGQSFLVGTLAHPSAPRCLLETGLGLRGFLAHPMRRPRRLRLGGQLFQFGRRDCLPAFHRRSLRSWAPGRTPIRAAAIRVRASAISRKRLRWWKYWLAGEDTGIMNEPLYRVWITGEERPRPWYKDHAGSWAAEEAWPSPRIDWQEFYLNETGLEPSARAWARHVGLFAGHGRHGLWPLGRLWRQIARSCHRPAPRRRPVACASTPRRSTTT